MEELDFYKIGKEMKRLRREHSFTQEQVAADLGCTVALSAISKITVPN